MFNIWALSLQIIQRRPNHNTQKPPPRLSAYFPFFPRPVSVVSCSARIVTTFHIPDASVITRSEQGSTKMTSWGVEVCGDAERGDEAGHLQPGGLRLLQGPRAGAGRQGRPGPRGSLLAPEQTQRGQCCLWLQSMEAFIEYFCCFWWIILTICHITMYYLLMSGAQHVRAQLKDC